MLKGTSNRVVAGEEATAPAAPAACVAARIVAGDSPRAIVVAEDEARAETIARLAAAFAPAKEVIHLTGSDALPGEAAPPSAANVGQRVEALRRLRTATASAANRPVLLVLSAEASAVRYAAPTAFDEAPPVFAVGDAIDVAALPALAESIGYVLDDRVDEPGEIAIRGSVVDLFPADRLHPVRIEFADGRVTTLRSYDPVTQLGLEDIEQVTIGRASEPPLGEGVPITAHLPDANIYLDPRAQDRRDRFLALAADGSTGRRSLAALVDDAAWRAAVADRRIVPGPDTGAPIPRFVERRDPLRAFRRFAGATLAEGRMVIAGAARDLRFLLPRLG